MNKFLLAGDKFMREIHLRLELHTMLVVHLLKTKKECKNLRKKEIQCVIIKANKTKPAFNTI